MVIDVPAELPSPCPPLSSASQSHSSSTGRHFYVAVDRLQFKMETLVDLLGVAGRRPWLPIVLCCSSRDELDAVCATVSNLSYISLSYLYSDLAEVERALVLERFRQATTEWSRFSAHPGETDGNSGQAQSHVFVVTDVCLPMVASGETPIQARVLINFDIPAKKESYVRRISTCLAAGFICICYLLTSRNTY
uniref:ATP-dependent RNA helicase eIF4A n=1 Tax=Anthurium amnicola TaxID=1678845 RepID=A0A1D1Y5U1_9ARAE